VAKAWLKLRERRSARATSGQWRCDPAGGRSTSPI